MLFVLSSLTEFDQMILYNPSNDNKELTQKPANGISIKLERLL